MKHCNIKNIPQNPKEIFDLALFKSFNMWIDEKDTIDNPSYVKRGKSKLSYEVAWDIIKSNKPHWTISFRNNSYFGEFDFWEFSGCNIAHNEYGSVFIWIEVLPQEAELIFEKFKLQKYTYPN